MITTSYRRLIQIYLIHPPCPFNYTFKKIKLCFALSTPFEPIAECLSISLYLVFIVTQDSFISLLSPANQSPLSGMFTFNALSNSSSNLILSYVGLRRVLKLPFKNDNLFSESMDN